MARKPHTYHYIYKTTCKVNDKFYIGMHSTSNLEDGYIGSGKRLWNSIKKHGKENHGIEILEWFPDRSSLKEREKEIVNESLLQEPMCMNLQIGGGGGFINEEHKEKATRAGGKAFSTRMKTDDDFRQNIIKQLSEHALENWQNEDYIKKMSLRVGFSGKKHTEETISKMKNSASKKTPEMNSQYGTRWITNGKENKKIKKTDILPEGWINGRKMIT
jgi:hypothetical protein